MGNTGLEATCELTVEPILLESISFDNLTYKIEVGGQKQLNVVFTPENATNKNVIWTSSDPVIAPVDENGVVLGIHQEEYKLRTTSEDGGHVAKLYCLYCVIRKYDGCLFPYVFFDY